MKNVFTSKGICLYLIVLSFFALSSPSFAQTAGRVAEKVTALKQKNSFAKEYDLFSAAAASRRSDIDKAVKKYTLLTVKNTADILASRPAFLNFTVPVENGAAVLRVLLYKESISPNGFTLMSSDGKTADAGDIVHYKGAIDGDVASVVAFSFSTNEVSGMISNSKGNFVLGKIANTTTHIIYNDKDLAIQNVLDCGTNTNIPLSAGNYYRPSATASTLTAKCVNWYWETDVDIFTAKGSLANVNTFMQGIFNQVQTLYANDGVSITLKTLYVWTTTDPYTGTSTSGYLDQFGAYRTIFDGDLATLIGTKGGGGIAWINGLCNSQSKYKMAYCGISTTYSVVPTYSWTVECITHEQGHLLGSRHTHDCVWNGNNTKIDGCGDNAGYTSGTCANPGNPSGGGTIMSYCHLTSTGINFNLGFGPQPKALIVANVNNAACLTNCNTGCTTPAQPAAITGSASVCAGTIQTYSVAAVAGATSYIWSLPNGWTGSSTGTSISTTAATTGGNISVTATNSCGASAAATFAVTVTTSPAPPASITGNSAVCSGTAQAYATAAVPGATSYTWTLPSGWTGSSTTNSISTTSGTSGGTVTVKANNACGSSTAASIQVNITAAAPTQPASISGATVVCPGTTQTYTASSVAGAGSYNWTIPSGWSGTSSTNSINVTSGSTGGIISVTASNGCGTSAAQTLNVSTGGTAPAAPGTITVSGGSANVCSGETRTYSVVATSGVSFTWVAPAGATINNGQGTNSVTISFSTSFSSPGTLSVTATNSCGTGPASTLVIQKNTISTPGAISVSGGTAKVCSGDTRTYTVAAVAGITYNWTVPAGASLNNGQGTNSVSITYTPNFIANGTLSVTANNQCGASAARNLTVARNLPATPAAISGPATICTGATGTYTATAVAGAISYVWTIPSGGVAQGSTNTNTISVRWTGNRAGNLAVKAVNNCGVSGSRSFKVTISCARQAIAESVIEDQSSAVVFPNPTSDIAQLRYHTREAKMYTFTVTDIAGRKLFSDKQQAFAGQNTKQFNFSAFTKGTYFILVESKESKQVLKINVQ